ncbi:aspartate/glutamate racemase family protein [Rahnella perminowiae]|jgi:aspartate racemase|uniref:Aspartate/glutamate racemase family protein n=1 Tax=Rahnella perminowiae TaxID=2816244 RepID=A0ABS6L4L8_9GAMM|nr:MULTISPECIES: aspartate/glutamate racemase family protein [Rahnella]UJD88357.1 aspartate/glutamate racemase family protein [Rahnella aquatilis]MBU9809743.1 aspartate/glutamate racemase family protein [Rahnella perminowiae]MBU9826991.1 aspartate/glutamate racemase family protein [Rahnella perminowiae]MBU9836812.1 aspartate/glutamate racemase family protein [Rahnella perminowiae]MCR9002561.1 aspartate/glutamate racemase family protein [Rahnella perminowiae]
MKTLGLIGGMSWESTVPYYRMINEQVKQQLGGLHSAKLFLYSVDFYDIEKLQMAGDWQQAGEILGNAAHSLARAGAQFIVVCTNTMHKVADDIERIGGLPLLHIADATAEKIAGQGLRKIGLLGTRFTMEQDFYRGRLQEKHQIDVVTPDEADRAIVHRIIYEELCLGVIRDDSREEYRRIIGKLEQQGVEGIILGCTEITLLVGEEDASVPVFDTTAIHALAAAEFALKQD